MSIQTFTYEDEAGNDIEVQYADSEFIAVNFNTQLGGSFVLNAQGLITQLVPATAIGLFNTTQLLGHNDGFAVKALQADGITPFPLDGIPILFYAKMNPTDTILLFNKSLATTPLDVMVPSPPTGVINVFVRAVDIAALAVGTTIFLYVDIVDILGTPWNLTKWTITIGV